MQLKISKAIEIVSVGSHLMIYNRLNNSTSCLDGHLQTILDILDQAANSCSVDYICKSLTEDLNQVETEKVMGHIDRCIKDLIEQDILEVTK